MAFLITDLEQDLDTDRFIIRGNIALTGSVGNGSTLPNGSVPKNVNLDKVYVWQTAGSTFLKMKVQQDLVNGTLSFISSATGTDEIFSFRAAFRGNADQDGSSINQDNDN